MSVEAADVKKKSTKHESLQQSNVQKKRKRPDGEQTSKRFLAFDKIEDTKIINLSYITNLKILSSKSKEAYTIQNMDTQVEVNEDDTQLESNLQKIKVPDHWPVDYSYSSEVHSYDKIKVRF